MAGAWCQPLTPSSADVKQKGRTIPLLSFWLFMAGYRVKFAHPKQVLQRERSSVTVFIFQYLNVPSMSSNSCLRFLLDFPSRIIMWTQFSIINTIPVFTFRYMFQNKLCSVKYTKTNNHTHISSFFILHDIGIGLAVVGWASLKMRFSWREVGNKQTSLWHNLSSEIKWQVNKIWTNGPNLSKATSHTISKILKVSVAWRISFFILGTISICIYTYIYKHNFIIYYFLWHCSPARAMTSSTRFLDRTQRRGTVGRSPLDEWLARRRDLYLTTGNTHNRQISMPPVGFETPIVVGERS
jgi:hypothetical protein